ncbi:MAG: Rrf2 family transcriptional regulator [Clostridia bacterium]|nr:Rrf2 family transcriptional regulator [Clostridia bacterium]
MKISTKGRYGLRIMTDIALNEKDGCVSIKDIANRENLSEKYLEQIINLLSKQGLVQSVRGAKGGYHLSKSAKEITVEEILLATEGSLAPVACAADSDCCENYCDCVTSFIWTKIYDAVIDVVHNISLEDLAERSLKCKCAPPECKPTK